MIRPNATRPSASMRSRWYSTCTAAARRAAARARDGPGAAFVRAGAGLGRAGPAFARADGRLAMRDPGAGRLRRERAEALAALLVVAELVVARARRREEDGVARRGVGSGAPDGRGEVAAALVGDARPLERRRDRIRRLADQVDAGDRAGGDVGRQLVVAATLARAAQDQADAAVERGERLAGRVGVG